MLTLDEINLPLITILRGITPEEAPEIADVFLEAGVQVVEVTLNSPDPYATLAILLEKCSDQMLVGAGTVTHPDEVQKIADLGAGLIVSPNLNKEVVEKTKECGLISAPGCLTATEIFAALSYGADVVKVFPGVIATPDVIKAYKAVLPPETKLVVTGNVSEATIPAYVKAGAFGMGLGSNLYSAGKSVEAVKHDLDKFIQAYNETK